MHYTNSDLGFSFDLPDGWKKDKTNLKLTFYGPNGGFGIKTEIIQIHIATILAEYQTPESREDFLSEPNAQVFRGKAGDENNVVILKKLHDSEISIVRDGIQYTILHSNDPTSESATEQLKQSIKFPTPKKAHSAIQSWSDPKSQAIMQILQGKKPISPSNIQSYSQKQKNKGVIKRILNFFQKEQKVYTCETCANKMQVLEFSGGGKVILSVESLTSGIGHAEQCWECGRLYCIECYPSRPPNTCVCGKGRNKIRHIGGAVYRGSLRLVKVRYVN